MRAVTVMNEINKQLQEYYREISKYVICPGKLKKEFLNQLKDDIDCFISDNPEATIEDVKENFGTAKAIAESFMQGMDVSGLNKKLNIRRVILITCIVALIIYAAFVVISLVDVHNEAHGHIEEGIMMIKTLGRGGIL